MSYINVTTTLPKELVAEIQKYVDGAYLYIPKCEGNKKAWGEGTDTRQTLAKRNAAIYEAYEGGMKAEALADSYYLSIKSIQRIVLNERKKRALVAQC